MKDQLTNHERRIFTLEVQIINLELKLMKLSERILQLEEKNERSTIRKTKSKKIHKRPR